MPIHRTAALAVALVAAALLACGSGGDLVVQPTPTPGAQPTPTPGASPTPSPTPDPGTGVQVTELSRRLRDRLAGLYESCFDVPRDVASAQTRLVFDGFLDKEIAAGRTRVDSSRIQPCLDAYTCGHLVGRDDPAACEGVVVGQVADGGACYLDADCQSGGSCVRSGAACPGRCRAPVPAGGDCSGDLRCVAGATCVMEGTRSICLASLAAGAVCFGPSGPAGRCPDGTTCGAELDQAGAPVCSAGVAIGRACTDVTGGARGTCVAGAICADPGTGEAPTCQAAPADGRPCALDASGQPRCGPASSCVSVAGGEPVCTARAPFDAPCSASGSDSVLADHPECVDGLSCQGGRCAGFAVAASPRKVNEACTPGNGECLVGFAYCSDAGRCTLRPQANGACLDPVADAQATKGVDYPACALGFFCDASHTCQAARPLGAACSGAAGECAGVDTYCDPAQKRCARFDVCRAP